MPATRDSLLASVLLVPEVLTAAVPGALVLEEASEWVWVRAAGMSWVGVWEAGDAARTWEDVDALLADWCDTSDARCSCACVSRSDVEASDDSCCGELTGRACLGGNSSMDTSMEPCSDAWAEEVEEEVDAGDELTRRSRAWSVLLVSRGLRERSGDVGLSARDRRSGDFALSGDFDLAFDRRRAASCDGHNEKNKKRTVSITAKMHASGVCCKYTCKHMACLDMLKIRVH